jgi:DNA mismatch repair protein MutL
MSDRIKLLPDNIANQIAAGEVIQRPASVVKELMENSVDSGATHIQVIVKNAGKTLVQIIDNGSGMSETDARMCFEKHATSKITSADDLFNIRTMGFRGEALASVAAIAQVELKTKLHHETLGTLIEIEGMKILKHEPCQTNSGTSIAVKNLFFNVPARRNFLKSDSAELRHIFDEFIRIALAHPKISFQLFTNELETLHYKSGNLKQRVCAVFDTRYESKIVPLSEDTPGLQISGFVGKPELAKKNRGEQYIFVNKRFVKSAYIHHAVMNAFEQMLAKESFPFYVLFIDIDPQRIDVNVHPQKYEVKFEDEKLIYTFVNLAVKHSLGSYSVMPTLDFSQEDALNKSGTFDQAPGWIVGNNDSSKTSEKKFAHDFYKADDKPTSNWEQLYETKSSRATSHLDKEVVDLKQETFFEQKDTEESLAFQVQKRYILSQIKSGFILVDQQSAHERVMFEHYIRIMAHNRKSSQQQLFPTTLEFGDMDAAILHEILPEINALGFDVQEFGNNSFIVHAFPADITLVNEKQTFEELIEQYKNNLSVSKLSKRENLAKSLACSTSIKRGQTLTRQEMKTLIDELFACENPYTAPGGKHTFITLSFDELEKRFDNR